MRRRARCWLGITVLVTLLAGGEAAAEVDILDYRLRDLMSADAMELDVFRGGVSVLMFFEPACPYCYRQARVLNELQRECKDLHPVAIGLNGDRRALQAEAAQMRAEFPVLEIDERLRRDIGKIEATPLMLIGDRSGMLVTWLRGLQTIDVLRDLITRVDASVCGPARARGVGTLFDHGHHDGVSAASTASQRPAVTTNADVDATIAAVASASSTP